MNQKDVTKKAFANAAALIECMDFEQLFGSPDEWAATEDQMDKAQQIVVEAIRARAGTTE
jgi:hypothetical protein